MYINTIIISVLFMMFTWFYVMLFALHVYDLRIYHLLSLIFTGQMGVLAAHHRWRNKANVYNRHKPRSMRYD